MERIKKKIKSARDFWDKKIVLKSLKALRTFADRRIRFRNDQFGPGQDWKEGIKEDFEAWLMDLEEPVISEDPDHVDRMDLFTLLGEFASLRKEIRLQSREQAKNIQGLKDFNGFVDQTGRLLNLMDEKISYLDAMEMGIQDRAEEKTLKIFLDLRNSLKRGVDSAQKSLKTPFFWRRKKINSLVQGYSIALNKFDKALAILNTFPIITEGEKFDLKTMRAVERVVVKGMESGIVRTEVACGFIRKERVLLPAQVIVTN